MAFSKGQKARRMKDIIEMHAAEAHTKGKAQRFRQLLCNSA